MGDIVKFPTEFEGDKTYQLILKFDDQSPSYAHGFSMGRLYAECQSGMSPIENQWLEANVGMIGKIARLFGYTAKWIETCEGWAKFKLEKES